MTLLGFLFWALISFGAFILWIGLVLVVDGLGGSLLMFLPLFLMPLFALIFSFFVSCHLRKSAFKGGEIFLPLFTGLFLSGLLHFIASGILRGFRLDLLNIAFYLTVIISLGLGVIFGIKIRDLIELNKKRRSRFDD